ILAELLQIGKDALLIEGLNIDKGAYAGNILNTRHGATDRFLERRFLPEFMVEIFCLPDRKAQHNKKRGDDYYDHQKTRKERACPFSSMRPFLQNMIGFLEKR